MIDRKAKAVIMHYLREWDIIKLVCENAFHFNF